MVYSPKHEHGTLERNPLVTHTIVVPQKEKTTLSMIFSVINIDCLAQY